MNLVKISALAATVIFSLFVLTYLGNHYLVSGQTPSSSSPQSNATNIIASNSTSIIVPVIITFKDQPTGDEINQFKDVKLIKRINLAGEQNLVESYGGVITQGSFLILNAIVANVTEDEIEKIKQDTTVLGV